MITAVDRIQITAFNAEEVAGRWIGLLGARTVAEDSVNLLNARRLTLAVGNGFVEVLEPLGPGPVEEHLRAQRGGPFAAGLAVASLDEARSRLAKAGVRFTGEGKQLHLDARALDIPGLRVVLTEARRNLPVGRLENIYEVTLLTADPRQASTRLATVFGLDPSHFVPIESELYGYRGSLTLFDPHRLDRLEIVYPFDTTRTMGRYFNRFGASLYMCFAECGDMASLRDALLDLVPHDWTGVKQGVPDSLFIHPKALGGVMLGVSRTTFAWTWSGSPDRVRD